MRFRAAVTQPTARLYTLAEVQDAAHMPPHCELDARFQVGLANALSWLRISGVRCAFCNNEVGGQATYLVVLMPADADAGYGSSGACCVGCGQRMPREHLQAMADQAARLMFEPIAGRA